jgi:hypothetical protein
MRNEFGGGKTLAGPELTDLRETIKKEAGEIKELKTRL